MYSNLWLSALLLLAISSSGQGMVRDADLIDFSDKLLEYDNNNAGHLIEITQGGKDSTTQYRPFSVHKSAKNLQTIKYLLNLFNATSAGKSSYTAERGAQLNFLRAIIQTPIMEEARMFLQRTGYIGRGTDELFQLLDSLWFTTYKRSGQESSGFKHVFMAEIKTRNGYNLVNGLHNWVYYMTQDEQQYITDVVMKKRLDFAKQKSGAVVTMQFMWKGARKDVGTMLIGTSPELELALYSICFLARPNEDCEVRLGGANFKIKTYLWSAGYTEVVATAYPVL